ncbi:TolC family protein [Undibacterium sp. Rencai35W]|uniref:TolC family protein n=1 Tax=Undibacterium sp. Rencai35W TaxID=3413046 RepID=UPI003BF0E0E5
MSVAISLATVLLSGCATFSSDGGFEFLEKNARTQLDKQVVWHKSDADQSRIQQYTDALLRQELSVETAVQVALLNNPGLQASFDELGIAEADLVQAGRLANPGFSFSRLHRGDEIEIDRGIHFNLVRLLTMQQTRKIEQRRFDATRMAILQAIYSLSSETRKAYFNLLTTTETLSYTGQVKDAAQAGAELAQRMQKAGNFSQLKQAREQSFYADAELNRQRAALAHSRASENFYRLLGLDMTRISLKLPERLPELPAVLETPAEMQQALSQRLDVQMALSNTDALAHNLGLNKFTRFINVLEIGAVKSSTSQQSNQTGYEISIELPLFDWGTARVAKAEAQYMQAIHRTADIALAARAELRQSYQQYQSSYAIAKHYRDEVLPLKKRISDENLLRYNGMLISVFELLADARSQIASVNASIEASRDFWFAQADWQMSKLGKSSGNSMTTGQNIGSESGDKPVSH